MDLEHTSLAHADAYLSHHGILGQKWGVRRYQNKDGTLTDAGKKRYVGSNGHFNASPIKGSVRQKRSKKDIEISKKYWSKLEDDASNEFKNIQSIKDRQQRAKAQAEYLKKATSYDATDADIAKYVYLGKEYNRKTGDWYDGTSISKDHAMVIDKMRSMSHDTFRTKRGQETYEKYRQELDSIVLRDLGFEDTKQNRENIRYIWEID